MPLKVFVGSSETALPFARRLAAALRRTKRVTVTTWDKAFEPGSHYIDSLQDALDRNDLFILLFTPDDQVVGDEAGQSRYVVRDNVIFEAGAALGRWGLQRLVLVQDAGVTRPSDLKGVTVIRFDRRKDAVGEARRIAGEIVQYLERSLADPRWHKRIRWLSLIKCAPTRQVEVVELIEQFEREAAEKFDVRYERGGVLWGPPDNFLLFSVPDVDSFFSFVTMLRQRFRDKIRAIDSRLIFTKRLWRNPRFRQGQRVTHLVLLPCAPHSVEHVYDRLVDEARHASPRASVIISYVGIITGEDDVFFVTSAPSVDAHQRFVGRINGILEPEWLSQNTTSLPVTKQLIRK